MGIMTEIDWDKVQELRELGLSWQHVADEIGVDNKILYCRRRDKGLPMGEQYKSNNGKRQCSYCCHNFPRKKLKLMHNRKHQGLVCPLCYQRLHKED